MSYVNPADRKKYVLRCESSRAEKGDAYCETHHTRHTPAPLPAITYQTMSRPEADKIVDRAEELLEVTMSSWQREILATLMMYPDLSFSLGR